MPKNPSKLSKAYDPKIAEKKIIEIHSNSQYNKPEFWSDALDTYTVVVPPPNLSGNLHAGHAFEHFLMDSIIRMARQRGFKTLYYPGVDHAGIQLEGVIDRFIAEGLFDEELKEKCFECFNVEKKDRANFLKKKNLELYLELAWKKANEFRSNQISLANEIGDSPDFDRLLFTLDDQSRNTVGHAFKKYWEDGLIYKGSYLINWSVALQTALSDVPEDIGRKTINDPFITYRYDIENVIIKSDNNNLFELKKYIYDALSNLYVGTVRIETAPASKELMAHPDRIKKLFQEKTDLDDAYIEGIIKAISNRQIIVQYQIPPFDLYKVELYLENTLDPEFGTGVMKFTPAHDPNDYEISKKHGIYNFPTVINKQGKLTEASGKYEGMDVYQARVLMMWELLHGGFVRTIKERVDVEEDFDREHFKSLEYREGVKYLRKFYSHCDIDWDYEHNVVICERSKTIVEPLISEEFFVNYKQEFEYKPNQAWKLNKLDFDKINFKSHNIHLQSIKQDISPFIYKNITSNDCDLLLAYNYSSQEETDSWVRGQIENNTNKKNLTLSIKDLEGKYLGYCFLRIENNQYKLTTWIAEGFRQKGHGSNALNAFISFIWKNFNTNKLIWEVKNENTASIALCKKCGFNLNKTENYQRVDKATGNVSVGSYSVFELDREKTTLQKLAIEGIKETNMKPEAYQERGVKYFENIRDWCISRDLVWGIRIPIWYNIDLNPQKRFYDYNQVSKTVNIEGKTYQIKDLMQISTSKPIINGNWVQEKKILDTWFSSTLWPLSTLNFVEYQKDNDLTSQFAKFYPTQLMTSAWEIYYAWIIRMIMNGKYFTGHTPFEDYCCHAWILDENGKKMSKSKGNVFDPRDQIANYSIDSTRMAMMSGCIPGKNMRFQGKLADVLGEKYRNLGNKIFNIAKFFEYKFESDQNLEQYCQEIISDNSKIHNLEISPASIWIYKKIIDLKNNIDQAMSSYNLSISIDAISKFIWDDFAPWYIEYLKIDSSQIPFGYLVFNTFIKLIYPFSPLESEYLNLEFFSQNDLLAESTLDTSYLHETALDEDKILQFENVKKVIEKIRSVKSLFGIEAHRSIEFYSPTKSITQFDKLISLLAKTNLSEKKDKKVYTIEGEGWLIELDIFGQIKNIEDEISRSKKHIASLEKQIKSLEKTLANDKFIASAQKEVIDQKMLDLEERKIDLINEQEKTNLLSNL